MAGIGAGCDMPSQPTGRLGTIQAYRGWLGGLVMPLSQCARSSCHRDSNSFASPVRVSRNHSPHPLKKLLTGVADLGDTKRKGCPRPEPPNPLRRLASSSTPFSPYYQRTPVGRTRPSVFTTRPTFSPQLPANARSLKITVTFPTSSPPSNSCSLESTS